MSVRENIAMGAAGKVEEDVIIVSAKRAAAHEFIGELEGGYDAPCGEKGGTLSGGQKQRIAIARALAKQAHILVFDEATSALDTESERHIMDTIHSLRNDHTILITTHNLENIITADKIIVLDNGNIAEMGTHNELMQKNGIYTRLYTTSPS
jgi:subfamily B ATP-binding cassette protein MsbA